MKGELDIKNEHNCFSIYYKKKRIYLFWLENFLLLTISVSLIFIHVLFYKNYMNIVIAIILFLSILPFKKNVSSKYFYMPICNLLLVDKNNILINNRKVELESNELKVIVKHHATQRGTLLFNIYLLEKPETRKILIENLIKYDLYSIIEGLKKYAIRNNKNIVIIDDKYSL